MNFTTQQNCQRDSETFWSFIVSVAWKFDEWHCRLWKIFYSTAYVVMAITGDGPRIGHEIEERNCNTYVLSMYSVGGRQGQFKPARGRTWSLSWVRDIPAINTSAPLPQIFPVLTIKMCRNIEPPHSRGGKKNEEEMEKLSPLVAVLAALLTSKKEWTLRLDENR